LTYHLGRRMFNAQVGLIAGLAMSTALMFDIVARAATPDSFLVFFCTLALYLFVRQENWQDGTPRSTATSLPWSLCASMYAVMGIAVLVKGPIGVILPGAVLGLYLLVRDPIGQLPVDTIWGDRLLLFLRRFTPARILRAFWSMRPLTAIAAVLLVAGPWFALVGWRTHGDFLREFFGTQNFGRFVNAMDNHSGGIWYYIPAILIGFFPWSIFAVPSALDLVRRSCGRESWQRGAKFLACWVVVFIGFFSLASTKLPNYALPAYPALALVTACFLDRWLARPESVNRWWPRLAFGSLFLVGLTTAIAAPLVAYGKAGGRPFLERLGIASNLRGDLALVGAVGAVLVVGGVACLVLTAMQRRRTAIAGLAITATVFSLALFAGMATRLDRYQPSPAVAEAIHRHAESAPQVAQFGYFRPSLVYYTDTRVEACKTPQRVAEFLQESSDAFLVTTDEQYTRLKPLLPPDVIVIDRQPEFPRAGNVLILKRTTSIAQRSEGAKQ
jgi:4-amino-4-deoxy-L-arabinose transferase-like glycosyltransferase